MTRPALLLTATLLAGCIPGYREAPPSANQSRRVETVELRAQRPVLRFIVVGDIHQKNEEPNRSNGARVARAIREHARRHPIDAVLLLGDNFDPCGVTSKSDPKWRLVGEMFGALSVPVFPILGNHDYGNPKRRYGKVWICGEPNPAAELGAAPLPNWHFPSRSYRLRTANADFFMLDSTPVAAGLEEPLLGSAGSTELLAWLKRDIPTAAGWRIVAGHHHILASGKERRKAAPTHERMQVLRQVLIDTDADLYISGHRHHLELIVPPAGQSHPVLLVSGAGGRPRPLPSVRKGSPPSVFPSEAPQGFAGYAVLEVEAEKLGVTFHDADGRAVSRRFELSRRSRQ